MPRNPTDKDGDNVVPILPAEKRRAARKTAAAAASFQPAGQPPKAPARAPAKRAAAKAVQPTLPKAPAKKAAAKTGKRQPSATITGPRIDVAERRAKALRMRRSGATFQEIADSLGYASRGKAHDDVRVAFDAITSTPAHEVLEAELSRLDGMLSKLWPKVERGQVTAVDRVLKIMERRARYLGLDSPIKQVLTGDPDGAPVLVASSDPGVARAAALAAIAALATATAPAGGTS